MYILVHTKPRNYVWFASCLLRIVIAVTMSDVNGHNSCSCRISPKVCSEWVRGLKMQIITEIKTSFSKITIDSQFQIFILCCDWLIALGFASGTYMINRHFVQQHEVAETYFVYNEYTTLCYPNLRLDDHYMIFQTCLSGTYDIVILFLYVIK